ncbi:MAG: maltose alpha-D-glucosyltransferase [Verrucomicrobiae bacterium]|nr:maltose alpha-D-glucosyltransferase [Verrucomicrobiae bacterium]
MATTRRTATAPRDGLDRDPHWYKSGVIYEVHVRAFCDSDGNGVGDFRGLTSKLDYLRDLGITALWLLPFYPSPLRDDGYDIADYFSVHPNYGTLADFRVFLKEAHRRGLRVITELVLNHTSDRHPWFQRARRAKPGSRWREFYVWSDTPDRYKDARIIFKDVEVSNWSWDHVAEAYYWHRFFSHQPDLNYDNPEVFEEMIRVLDFWLDLGVDGVRLDAVPYLFEREGTSCENLPETHEALKRLRAHVDRKYGDRMLLGEANQWPEDAVAYFGGGRGDECHMAFHFPLMPRLFMALRMEDRTPIVDILEQTPAIPETAQWALFLRNHDELTLEMVTDEERDYMYRMYAHVQMARLNLGIRRRLAPLLGNDRKRIELLNALLFSLPGTPVLYYGDEIGLGENIFLGDRNGVRTPMQWSSDKNAGFSRGNPQSLYLPIIYDPEYHYEAVNVEAQLGNPHSLLWWMRRLLALRKRWRALGEGRCEFLQPENRRILSFLLRHGNETLLVVANLSRFVQPVELDLAAHRNTVPVELFGRNAFPPIEDRPYFLTLGPHAFYWFSLEPRSANGEGERAAHGPGARGFTVGKSWRELLSGRGRTALEAALPDFLRGQRWFGAKARTIKQVSLTASVPLGGGDDAPHLVLARVDYVQGDPEVYLLPLAFVAGGQAGPLLERWPRLVLGEVQGADGTRGWLVDAGVGSELGRALIEAIRNRRHVRGEGGELEGSRTGVLRRLLGEGPAPEPSPLRAEQSNTSMVYGDKLILKVFRRLEAGTNPDLEIGRFLAQRGFAHTPELAGALEWAGPGGARMTLGILHGLVANAKDAWELTLDSLGRFYERVGPLDAQGQTAPALGSDPLRWTAGTWPAGVPETVGTYIESARMLGERTAALHLALSADTEEEPAFAPEPFTPHYLRGVFQSMRNQAMVSLRLLRRQIRQLPEDVVALAEEVLGLEGAIVERFRPVFERRIVAWRTRIHGDYHLGQVLWTGKDFVIFDFEGEPALALGERILKRSPLRDVAGMLRSFEYAAHAALRQHVERGSLEVERVGRFEPWARMWQTAVGGTYLGAYFGAMSGSSVLPGSEEDRRAMLEAYVLDKALYELGYELNHRPDWVRIPLSGIRRLVVETR